MMELVQQLVSSAGVNEEQAQGGAGLLFNLLKDKLSAEDFAQVTDVVPDVENLITAAPEGGGGGLGGLLSGVTSALGLGGSKLDNLASLAGGFSKLGLDADMVGKFIPIVLAFVQSKGGDGLAEIVGKVLKGE